MLLCLTLCANDTAVVMKRQLVRARYIEAIRKLKKDGVKLKRTVHVVFGPGNSLFVSPSPVLPSHRYTHAHALTHARTPIITVFVKRKTLFIQSGFLSERKGKVIPC